MKSSKGCYRYRERNWSDILTTLLGILSTNPFFSNTKNCMDALKKYVMKSKKFANLFFLNFGILSLILMMALIRMTMGLIRNKPVTLIFIAIIILGVIITFHLISLMKLMFTLVIPKYLQKRDFT